MIKSNEWALVGVRLTRTLPWAVATATISFSALPQVAMAAGTAAGTTISNTASVSYTDPSGTPQTTPSNTVDIKVDELLDVTVVSADPGDVPVQPNSTNKVLSFTVTNTGNGSEAFHLTSNGAIGGDQFDPTVTSIYLDNPSSGTVGLYDPGVDILYVPGSNDPVLAPDASRNVFILSSIPNASDTNRGLASLTAAAVTGTGAPGTVFANAGQGGSDAVVGTTGADSVDQGAYVIQSVSVSLAKMATVLDPFGGSEPVPGAIVTYTLTATTSGTGTLGNLEISDAVPANTTFQSGTIFLGTTNLTDTTDTDAGEIASGTVKVRLGSLAGGVTRVVTFKVRIN